MQQGSKNKSQALNGSEGSSKCWHNDRTITWLAMDQMSISFFKLVEANLGQLNLVFIYLCYFISAELIESTRRLAGTPLINSHLELSYNCRANICATHTFWVLTIFYVPLAVTGEYSTWQCWHSIIFNRELSPDATLMPDIDWLNEYHLSTAKRSQAASNSI